MADLRPLRLDSAEGEWLSLQEYLDDFDVHFGRVRDRDCWKLERKQYFHEGDNPSWNAFRRGDVTEARRLLEERAPALRAAADDAASRGSVFRRVRIVERPLTPYVQWELRSLVVRSKNRGPVRVAAAESVGELERDEPLPELVALGGRVLFHIQYTEEGVPTGAFRFTDSVVVERWERFVAGLFDAAEDVGSYVERHVAPFPPPSAPPSAPPSVV